MGKTTKGISGAANYPISERRYIFSCGWDYPALTGGLTGHGYELFNSRSIADGGISDDSTGYTASLWIFKPSTKDCCLAGTNNKISFDGKRFLAVQIKKDDGANNGDFRIIISKTKDLGDDQNTVYYTETAISEDFKTFYIDLTELTFTEGYVCFAVGALGNVIGTAGFRIHRVYLTNENDSMHKIKYNRGDTFDNANPPIGWEGPTNYVDYNPATLETDHIEFTTTSNKGAVIQTTRETEIFGRQICLLADVSSVAATDVKMYISFGKIGETQKAVYNRSLQAGNNQVIKSWIVNADIKAIDEYQISIFAQPGTNMNIKAIWLE